MISLNDYANSMFRYEFINENWLDRCTAYLNYILKDKIRNKIIIDYAFGRGNWSIAFIKAGAKEVYAIDASKSNCEKFQEYCNNNNYKNIKVIHGNILENKYEIEADLIWCYGIMHIFDSTDRSNFVHKIKSFASDNGTLFYFYEYNSESLREFIVQTSRKLLKYDSEEEFLKDSFSYMRSARMRVRDDLTTLNANFYNQIELQRFYQEHGLFPIQQDIDFQEFLGKKNEEFYPYQFLCSLADSGTIQLSEQISPYSEEREILKIIAKELDFLNLNNDAKRRIVIGLNNTHYGYLTDGRLIKNSIIELFNFLMYVLIRNIDNIQISNETTKQYLELFFKALRGGERGKYYKILGENIIVKHLVENTIRV
jgi:hypothetical protein